MRAVLGTALIISGIENFRTDQAFELTALQVLSIGVGALLIAGFWTPIAGSLVVIIAIWGALTQRAGLCPAVLSATIGAGLALVGPGTWSMDAWLFGWKRIDLED
jgi:hypothetical protein